MSSDFMDSVLLDGVNSIKDVNFFNLNNKLL